MRLIDADELKETIAENVYLVSDYFNSKDYGMFWTGGIEKAIDEQPTIASDRQTGEWIARDVEVPYGDRTTPVTFYMCTVCGLDQPEAMYKFCPCCGARMI